MWSFVTGFFHSASSFQLHPCCSVCQDFVPFYDSLFLFYLFSFIVCLLRKGCSMREEILRLKRGEGCVPCHTAHVEHSLNGSTGLLLHGRLPATLGSAMLCVSLKPNQLRPLMDYLRPPGSVRTRSGWFRKRPTCIPVV